MKKVPERTNLLHSLGAFKDAPPSALKHARKVSKIMKELTSTDAYSEKDKQKIRDAKNSMEWQVWEATLQTFPKGYARNISQEKELALALAIMKSCHDAIGKIAQLEDIDDSVITTMIQCTLPLEKQAPEISDPLHYIHTTSTYRGSRNLNKRNLPKDEEKIDDIDKFPL